jgi:hypothetical protein
MMIMHFHAQHFHVVGISQTFCPGWPSNYSPPDLYLPVVFLNIVILIGVRWNLNIV